MIFSTYIFVFVFLPIVLFVYFGMSRFVSRLTQHLFLIAASLVFYGYAHVNYIFLIMASVMVNYISASAVQYITNGIQRKAAFVTGVLFNIGLLGYYKYTNFFIENINFVFNTSFTLKHIILPLGISFFTFQQIAFLISVWKREERVPSVIEYTLFITFFPQLVAGPIVFSQDVMAQYQDEKNRCFNLDNFNKGLFIFAIGLFKKCVIADSLSIFVSNGYTDPGVAYLTFGQAWVVSISYTLQIFFDFSGYSDMAIGLAKMMNINLPVNFYSPYKSKSITEFWKRWHMTLGRSLAVLIYFPLGGNRKGLPRTCFNLFMVFLVSGIWHGAAWTFVIWGVMHGVLRVIEKLFDKQISKAPSFIRIFFTFMFANIAWVLFRSPNTHYAYIMFEKMFFPGKQYFILDGVGKLAVDGILNYPYQIATVYVLAFVAILLLIVFFYKKSSIDLYNEFKPNITRAALTAVLFSISVIHLSRISPFIYFNF